jgi:glycosyltransferase involved in cell wall biosynthesis
VLSLNVAHFITGGETGGSKKHVITLLQKLHCEKVCLILLQEGEFADEARAAGIWVEVFPQRSRYDVRVIARIAAFLRKHDFHILHTHGPRANLFGVRLRRSGQHIWVTTIHSDPTLDFMAGGLRGRIFTALSLFALRRVDHYFAVSERFKQKIASFGIDSRKITTIYNGIDYATPLERDCELRHALGYADSDFVMLSVGRLHPIKGHHELLLAMAELKNSVSIRLIVVGDGPYREEIKQFVEELGLQQNVQLLGYRTDIRELYSMCDIGLLTSYSESFPFVMLEPANESKPIISTDVGGVSELIIDPSYGWVIPPRDVDAIRNAILEAYEDYKNGDLAKKGAAFRERATTYYSLDKLAAITLETYTAL